MTDREESVLAIDRFVEAARSFCDWLEGEPIDAASERFTALVFLSELYSQALRFPEIHAAKGDPDGDNLSQELSDRVMKRLDGFPTRVYLRLEQGETAEDDVARDLYLTYASVKRGILQFDRGEDYHQYAIWYWQFTFWLDWGNHAVHAIQALHEQIQKELTKE